jgi:hypothetical protein
MPGVRSQETVLILHVLKQLHVEMASLQEQVQDVQSVLERMEGSHLTFDVYESDESSDESVESTNSAPF